MDEYQSFKDNLNEKIDADFEKYLKSDFFIGKYRKVFTPELKEMLRDTYNVGGKRALTQIRETLTKAVRNPREMMKILKGAGV